MPLWPGCQTFIFKRNTIALFNTSSKCSKFSVSVPNAYSTFGLSFLILLLVLIPIFRNKRVKIWKITWYEREQERRIIKWMNSGTNDICVQHARVLFWDTLISSIWWDLITCSQVIILLEIRVRKNPSPVSRIYLV